jgi:amidophosphoribosyltransferase
LFDGMTVLQHRGQDAAGIVTSERGRLHLRKDNGLVRDVFQQHHMEELRGNVGVGHVRYPTAGSSSCAEAQPLYTNYPHGICVAHNGNLTNTDELHSRMTKSQRHVNTDSDSELLLNLFAETLTTQEKECDNRIEAVFATCKELMHQRRLCHCLLHQWRRISWLQGSSWYPSARLWVPIQRPRRFAEDLDDRYVERCGQKT